MLIKASQYFEITLFSINFTSVFINTCDDSQMNLHKDNFLMSFYKHLILLYNTSIMPVFTEEEKRILLQTPIELILYHFGKATEHSRRNMFYSSFRDECTFIASVRNGFVSLSQYSYPTEKQTELTDIVTYTKKKSCRNNSSSIIYMQMCDFSLHFHLPLEDLLEVVCLRVAYVSLGGFVVSLGDIVSDIVVVVLRCTCIDVHDSRRNLSCFRILKI